MFNIYEISKEPVDIKWYYQKEGEWYGTFTIDDKEYDVSHKQLFYGAQCNIAFAECVLNDEQNQGIRACSDAIVNVLKGLSKENKKLQVSYGETLTISDLKKFIAKGLLE